MSSRAVSRSRADRPPDALPAWLVVTGAAALPTTLGACLVGALLAVRADGASWALALLALLVVAVAHVCGSLMSSLTRRGSGASDRPSRAARLLASGVVRRRTAGLTVIVLWLLGSALVVGLAVARGWPVVAFAAAGVVLALARLVRPRAPGLDELDALLLRGPLLVAGTFYATAGSLPWQVWLAGVPWGLLCAGVRLGEQLDATADDARPGRRTPAARLGEAGARRLVLLLLVAVYAVTGLAVAVGALPWPALVVALGLPLLRSVAGTLRRPRPPARPDGPGRPVLGPALTRHLRAFAVLLVLGCALAAVLDVGVPVGGA